MFYVISMILVARGTGRMHRSKADRKRQTANGKEQNANANSSQQTANSKQQTAICMPGFRLRP
jgi:hypothetical protein